MPNGECGEARSFDEQLVVVEHAGLLVQLLGQQLTVAGRPVEDVGRPVVRDRRRAGQVAVASVVADDERVRAVEGGRHDHGSTVTGVAPACRRVEQPVVDVVDDERRNVDAADDQPTTCRLINAAVQLQLRTIDAAVDTPQQVPVAQMTIASHASITLQRSNILAAVFSGESGTGLAGSPSIFTCSTRETQSVNQSPITLHNEE